MSAHAKLSASGSHTWLHCPGAIAACENLEDDDNAAAAFGTAAHEVAEKCILNDIDTIAYKGYVAENGVLCEMDMLRPLQIYVDLIVENIILSDEVLIEKRVDFSRYVPQGFGTSDCVMKQGKKLKIIDLKMGRVKVYAFWNSQLLLYALGALELFDDIEEIECVIVQPLIGWIDSFSIGKNELISWADEYVAVRAKRAFEGFAELVFGVPQCTYCRNLPHCKEAYRGLQNILELMSKDMDKLTTEEIENVLALEGVAIKWFSKLKIELMKRIDSGENSTNFTTGESLKHLIWSKELSEEQLVNNLKSCGLDEESCYTKTTISPSKARQLLGDKFKQISDFVERPKGNPVLKPLK